MNTAKIVKKFCLKSQTSYKQTLQEVREMTTDQRGARLKAMREFLANKNIGLPEIQWSDDQILQAQKLLESHPSTRLPRSMTSA